MLVETIFRPTLYSGLRPGTFFKVLRDKHHFFGLAVVNSREDLCSLIFSKSQPQTGVPRFSTGEDLSGTILAIPDAVIRPEHGSMAAFDGDIPIGALICDAAGSYIRASAGIGSTLTFDVGSGLRVNLQGHEGSPVVYPHWSVGTVIDGEFEAIFRFPSATSGSQSLNI